MLRLGFRCLSGLMYVPFFLQFLNPWIMVKKGGKLPPGHINDWFWEDKDMKDYMATRLPKGSMSHQSSCMYSSDHSLTHSLTHSFTHSLTHTLTHSLTHSLTHWTKT